MRWCGRERKIICDGRSGRREGLKGEKGAGGKGKGRKKGREEAGGCQGIQAREMGRGRQ